MSVPLLAAQVERPPDVPVRVFNKSRNNAGRRSLLWYTRGNYGDHFKRNARTAPGGEYNYEAPSAKYAKRKLNKFGHADPAKLRGHTQRRAGQTRVTATAKRARFVVKPGHAVPDWLRRGLETIAAADVVQIVDRYGQFVVVDITDFRSSRQRVRLS